MKIVRTKHGLRLSQHGVVISELRTSPGPTHSVFDVLAAVIAELKPAGRIGVLGFAGGGMMAPLRFMGVQTAIQSVDLDRAGYDLFCQHCPGWKRLVKWQQADAVVWLRRQSRPFNLLMDDLSVPYDGDVIKPDVSWRVLPELIRQRLESNGVGVFNLLRPPSGKWRPDVERIAGLFGAAQIIELDEFENRILVVSQRLPSARKLGGSLRRALIGLRSRQAGRFHVRTLH